MCRDGPCDVAVCIGLLGGGGSFMRVPCRQYNKDILFYKKSCFVQNKRSCRILLRWLLVTVRLVTCMVACYYVLS